MRGSRWTRFSDYTSEGRLTRNVGVQEGIGIRWTRDSW